MAPELRNGEGAGQGYLGTAVDVWAAGVLLVVMLLGTPPPPPPPPPLGYFPPPVRRCARI